MCGRFTLKTPVVEWLCALFPTDRSLLEPLARALQRANPLLSAPRYNISPTQPIWSITQTQDGQETVVDGVVVEGEPVRMMRWGLVPSWAESTKVAYSMINARSETLLEKPSFKNLIRGHRCAIVADGYYEWHQHVGDAETASPKQPYWIHRPGEQPFAMAGLWTENRKVQPNQVLASATIITTDANVDTADVHDRMPVLLQDREAMHRWLAVDATLEEITEMLVPADPGYLQTRAVSVQVNSPRHDGPKLIEEPPSSD
jgi:putative SOS response-associated peptidase YedK